ncbi:MAG TPA: hypothetical protein VD968_06130, partial [Pyrinomonadaceae bacterium]|nr:hypothetical protein [Pyrinomonadaceae bacterium]
TDTDAISVARAEYAVSRKVLRVTATSTSASATLSVHVTSTGALIGTLANTGGGKHSGAFALPASPRSVTVRSSLGGAASKGVTPK